MVTLIVACEIGFWVVLLAALAARYLLRWQRTSTVLLVCVPLVDVVLLAATVIDLANGGSAGSVHGLAAVYLGVSVAFGHSMIRWADGHFAYRFAGGPRPVKKPKSGPARVRHEWREWGKFMIAYAIACTVMAFLIFVISTPDHTTALWQGTIPHMSVVAGIWLLVTISDTFRKASPVES
nr:Putative membrane protein [Kibdelosporangium sp. MJ126-NF4]CTQ92694.1 Putative membrane protein [Kibdelosporangium sp. MJ126-NF4]